MNNIVTAAKALLDKWPTNKNLSEEVQALQAAIESEVYPSRVGHKMVCGQCGSEDVKRDAWAEWNPDTGSWELENVFDAAYCQNCDDNGAPGTFGAGQDASIKELDASGKEVE